MLALEYINSVERYNEIRLPFEIEHPPRSLEITYWSTAWSSYVDQLNLLVIYQIRKQSHTTVNSRHLLKVPKNIFRHLLHLLTYRPSYFCSQVSFCARQNLHRKSETQKTEYIKIGLFLQAFGDYPFTALHTFHYSPNATLFHGNVHTSLVEPSLI